VVLACLLFNLPTGLGCAAVEGWSTVQIRPLLKFFMDEVMRSIFSKKRGEVLELHSPGCNSVVF
jgi:hypothetical protein